MYISLIELKMLRSIIWSIWKCTNYIGQIFRMRHNPLDFDKMQRIPRRYPLRSILVDNIYMAINLTFRILRYFMADNLISIKTHFEIVQNVKLDKKQRVLWHLVNFITCGLHVSAPCNIFMASKYFRTCNYKHFVKLYFW